MLLSVSKVVVFVQAAEFSGHKQVATDNGRVFFFSLVILELKVKNQAKPSQSFFIKEYKKKESNFYYGHIFIIFISNVVCFTERGPNFQPSILEGPKGQKYFYG